MLMMPLVQNAELDYGAGAGASYALGDLDRDLQPLINGKKLAVATAK